MKRVIISIIIMSLVCAMAVITYKPIDDLIKVSATATKSPQIILDAGHGGLTNTIN